ncbi:MAG: DUF1178 family protein [Proteobacteria bacterium]|nr:DUF1178 family protein [Pseudomonadota bacterium]
MIRYELKCAEGHGFDSWFQSASAFDDLSERGLLSCGVCGSSDVSKAIMAPRVAPSDGDGPQIVHKASMPSSAPARTLSAPDGKLQEMIQAMRKHVEENSTYVGKNFVKEARAIHDGTAPERMIHGEAAPGEAKALIEEGVQIAPLPFLPKSKAN